MRDSRGRSANPRKLGDVLGAFRTDVAPPTPLAAVQAVWEDVVGEKIAAVTEVMTESEGVITVSCSSATWAQELEMMGPRILAGLKERVGDGAPLKIRFRALV